MADEWYGLRSCEKIASKAPRLEILPLKMNNLRRRFFTVFNFFTASEAIPG